MPSSYFDFKDEIKNYVYDKFSTDIKILDVGPGEGTYAQLLPDYKNIDCVEIYQPYINTYNLTSQYKNVYNTNIMDFEFEYYDIIILGDILEHLSIEDSLKLLDRILDRCKEIIISVPYLADFNYLYVDEPNRNELHIQTDLTETVMTERYPMLRMVWSNGNRIGVYMKNRKIGIVMTYYNRQYQLNKTLETINKQDCRDVTVVIVDDGSDEEIKLISEYIFKIYIIRIDGEKKWTNPEPAYNTGFAYLLDNTDCEIVISQNAECYHVGEIINYVKDYVTRSNYLTFGCYSLDEKNTFNPEHNIFKIIEQNNNPIQVVQENGWYNHPVLRPVGLEFCSAIHRKNLIKLNGYDERFSVEGIGFGDDYLLNRIRKLGLKVDIISHPFVVHQYHTYNHDPRKKESDELIKRSYLLFQYLIKKGEIRAKHIFTKDLC